MRYEDNLEEIDDLIINLKLSKLQLTIYSCILKDKEDELEDCKNALDEISNKIEELKQLRNIVEKLENIRG